MTMGRSRYADVSVARLEVVLSRRRRPSVFWPIVPRRWWFWVPEGTTEFTVRALRDHSAMTQREGIRLYSLQFKLSLRTKEWGETEATSLLEH